MTRSKDESDQLESKIDQLAEQLQAIKEMLSAMVSQGAITHDQAMQPVAMGPSAAAFLTGGVAAVRELNKQRAAAQRSEKAAKRRMLKGGRV